MEGRQLDDDRSPIALDHGLRKKNRGGTDRRGIDRSGRRGVRRRVELDERLDLDVNRQRADPTSGSRNSESTNPGPEPSKEFLSSGENGQLAKIGKESSGADREAASLALEKSLRRPRSRRLGDSVLDSGSVRARTTRTVRSRR